MKTKKWIIGFAILFVIVFSMASCTKTAALDTPKQTSVDKGWMEWFNHQYISEGDLKWYYRNMIDYAFNMDLLKKAKAKWYHTVEDGNDLIIKEGEFYSSLSERMATFKVVFLVKKDPATVKLIYFKNDNVIAKTPSDCALIARAQRAMYEMAVPDGDPMPPKK